MVRLRVARAVELLETTADSITDIAYSLGYADGNYFSRQVRAVAGMAPREARLRRASAA
jgi:transcriptional regulator GlxA family with amidase domain